jgi:YVTN family beta-propeller protein
MTTLSIPTGKLPYGIWPSGDGTRVYVDLENEDKIAAVDTLTTKVIAESPVGQAPQARRAARRSGPSAG